MIPKTQLDSQPKDDGRTGPTHAVVVVSGDHMGWPPFSEAALRREREREREDRKEERERGREGGGSSI